MKTLILLISFLSGSQFYLKVIYGFSSGIMTFCSCHTNYNARKWDNYIQSTWAIRNYLVNILNVRGNYGSEDEC